MTKTQLIYEHTQENVKDTCTDDNVVQSRLIPSVSFSYEFLDSYFVECFRECALFPRHHHHYHHQSEEQEQAQTVEEVEE